MLNIKKALSALLILVVLCTVSGCSKVDKNYGKSPENKKADTTDIAKTEPAKIMSSDRVMSTYFDISLFDEENYSDIYLGKKFKISASFDGSNIVVPCRIVDMEALGWELSEGNEYDKGSLVFAYETVEATFVNAKGTKLSAKFYNSSRSSVKLENCYIVLFRIENDFYSKGENCTPFDVNGINNTVAITDVINILGTPSHFYEVNRNNYYLDYFITKKDRRNGITVYINPVDDCVTAVEFSFYK